MRKIAHTIKEYFELNQMRKNTHWRLIDEKWMFEHNGIWHPNELFDEIYPQYDYKVFSDKGPNPGRTYA